MKDKLNATFPCLMVISEKGREFDGPLYVHLHNEEDVRRANSRLADKREAYGWSPGVAIRQYSTEYTTAAEHDADVVACMAEPNSSTKDPKPTYEQLEEKIVRLDGMLEQRVKEVDSLYQEGRSPRGTVEMLQQELRVERVKVNDLRRQLQDEVTYSHELELEVAKHREKMIPTFGAPITGMTFPFTIDTPHRDIVEIAVTWVGIANGKHRVHMTADIRLPETQPQEAPSPVGGPEFVEVRYVPGVVTQLSLDLVAPPPEPVTEPAAPPPTPTEYTPSIVGSYGVSLTKNGNTAGRSQDHTNLLAYEQAAAATVADREDEYIAARVKEAAKAATTLTFGGVTIGVDGDMLFLTDMWKAAGSDDSKKPARWRALPGAQEFIEFIEESVIGKSDNESFRTVRGGADQGTWAHWQLGMAYAKYLSPSFHAWCNSVVRAHMLGRVAPAPPASFVEPKSTMDWHKHLMEMHKQSMEREQTWHGTVRLLEEKNRETVALLKAENDGQAEVITAQYSQLAEYKDFFAGGDTGVSTVALSMGYSEQFFFALMREHGLIVNGRTAGWSYSLQTDPYKEYIDKGWFVVRPNLPHRRRHPFTGKMEVKQSSTTLITNLGWLNLHKMYGEHGTYWQSSKPADLLHVSPANRRVTAGELDEYRRKLWAMWTKEAIAQGMRYSDIPPYPHAKKRR
jgi:hypothetical protein